MGEMTFRNAHECLYYTVMAASRSYMTLEQVQAVADGAKNLNIKNEMYNGSIFIMMTGGKQIVVSMHRLMEGQYPPQTVSSQWQVAWESCGRPGDGLKQKFKNWWDHPLGLSPLHPAPVTARWSFPEITLSPETIRNAAAVVEAMMIGAMTFLALAGI